MGRSLPTHAGSSSTGMQVALQVTLDHGQQQMLRRQQNASLSNMLGAVGTMLLGVTPLMLV